MILEAISVLHRTGQWCPGVRTANAVIAYDVPILPQYLLDLDELGDALEAGAIDTGAAVKVLRNTQHFIERHLRRPDQASPTAWPDFPPAALLPLIDLPPLAG
ncbi:hypothetical protein [Kribbella lupini]|uniref:Uncharacterized protein n=1 Tax=Kribbella lupini TaxID=291602 RepID=A0ABP4MLD7_9ACTN